MTRVEVLPADDGGCGWYRLRYPCQQLPDVTVRDEWPRGVFQDLDGVPHLFAVDCQADVLVVQRPMNRETVLAIPLLQRQGTAVVVEIDDDFEHLPQKHPARRETAPVNNPMTNRLWLRKACERADLVTVSTPALAEVYAPHGRYAILPNLIPKRYLRYKPGTARPTVGWTGSVVTHVGDLEQTGGAVGDVLHETGAVLKVVGTGKGVAERLDYAGPVTSTGWLPVKEYPKAYARMTAAVVPLELNRFNEAKSWLKGIEAAALGVPFVASPTGPYRRLHDLGAGLLADTPDDWRTLVRRLVTDPGFHGEQQAQNREIASRLTYEEHAWRWQEAWQEAIRHHRNRYKGAA